MAVSSTTVGQPKYGLRNDSDGLRIVLPTSAFDPIIRLASASVASSSGTKQMPYDVFINYCGQDVKHTLASSIYNSLYATGLRVFLDRDELKDGDFFPKVIEEAMANASLHIAIFSEHYAQSPWCLEELAFMLKTGTRIIPVFHHVEPATLRWAIEGKGMYADALSKYERKSSNIGSHALKRVLQRVSFGFVDITKHIGDEQEKKSRYSSEQLQLWKLALHEASFFTGDRIDNSDDEQRVVKNVVNLVMKVMNCVPLEVAKHPVGLDEAVQDFDKIAHQSVGPIQIVGIWGMAGSGKTTLAKAIFNKRYSAVDRSSFLFDVRDAVGKGLLVEKQKKLLEDLGVKGLSFDNVEAGKGILKNRLRSVSVLIILDDVDYINQLDDLLPARESLGYRSLVIVTTRDLDVLKAWGVSAIYEMKPLNATYAKQLFCWHAFLQPFPLSGFKDLVEKSLNACHGLPLSLEVFGAQLYGRSAKDYRQALLDKISRLLPDDIMLRLKVSYDALDDEEKQMFLDTACFLIGEKKSLAIAIWDGCGRQLETLMNKSLVELDQNSGIRMQGPLRDLGRQIANEQPPYRLWSSTQIHLINKHAEETLQIRGIMAAITQFSACSAHHEFPSYSSPFQPPFEECLKIMQNSISQAPQRRPFSLGLKLLVVTGDYFSSKFGELSELVWLRWFDFKQAKLPLWKSLKNLRVLELYGATTLKELWEDGEQPPFLQLTELNITCSWGSGLQKFPSSISDLKHLKKIALIGYLGDEFPIKRLPEEFCGLNELEHLELRHCRVLSSLPSRFGELTMLRHLDLCSCVELRMLPVSFRQLKHLEYLDLSGCRKLTFRLDFLENISKLEKLDFSGCRRLQVLPERITSQGYLRQLNMRGTRLRNMPREMGELRNLENLQIGSPFLTDLPSSLGDLSSLTRLTIFDCPNLKDLPDSMESLKSLEYLCIECSGVECLPKSFRKLANLQTLEISGCPISEFDFGEGSSSSSCMRSLKVLRIADTQVSMISISDDCCPVLETLQLMQNEFLEEVVSLPTSLEEIELWECERLKDITCIHGLPNLKIKNIQIKISGYQS